MEPSRTSPSPPATWTRVTTAAWAWSGVTTTTTAGPTFSWRTTPTPICSTTTTATEPSARWLSRRGGPSTMTAGGGRAWETTLGATTTTAGVVLWARTSTARRTPPAPTTATGP